MGKTSQKGRKLIGGTDDRPRPQAVDYLFPLPLLSSSPPPPSAEREEAIQPTRVRHLTIWHQQRPSFFLTSLGPLLFENSAEKEKTIFRIILAVISRLPSDSGTGPSPDLSILLHTGRTPLAQS
ncbi:hypothetical protein NQZ68_001840 [Dissostichus eleginoides]|nr:hypothetical protein NQZ68_001840 [Dissostichus eleginoides]